MGTHILPILLRIIRYINFYYLLTARPKRLANIFFHIHTLVYIAERNSPLLLRLNSRGIFKDHSAIHTAFSTNIWIFSFVANWD